MVMSVLLVQRWILARLRNRQFFSLREPNAAIAELLAVLTTVRWKPASAFVDCARARRLSGIDYRGKSVTVQGGLLCVL